jgi:hypothetical protein
LLSLPQGERNRCRTLGAYLSPCGRGYKIKILASAKSQILLVRGWSTLGGVIEKSSK